MQILRQQNQVVAVVALVATVMAVLIGHIYLAAKNGNELIVLGAILVEFRHIVVKLLDAVHVAMVGYGHAAHTVGYGLINQ